MEMVEVTVYYLEMLAPSHSSVPAPRGGLSATRVSSPTVPYYRSLYDAVGKEFYWLSRRKMTDEALEPEGIEDDEQLADWIERAIKFVKTLPRK